MIPRVLIIAGSDSGGGAGIQADIKTVTLLGGHAMTAITALTAQNTLGVQGVLPVSPEFVVQQIDSCVGDIGVDAVKIGMLGSAEIAHAVAGRLEGIGVPIVFDPVMVATSGSVLADDATVAAFGRLMTLATVVTPNLPELEALGGERAVLAQGAALLVKGGHAEGEEVKDRLVTPDGEHLWMHRRIDTRHTHGTGCTLASAIATWLAAGASLADATGRAIAFVEQVLAAAPGLGAGHGPMGHAMGRVPFDDMLAAIHPAGWDGATFAAKRQPCPD
ncbi:bifunctional hydroxymethylpyrimidine kinase/phosphomethylpyrimidine kinase [Sphingomonas aracearum]|uniref:hydroxymethylpyrimidine kinase n=1 Tax=Sphingomonas aracearum TaxID=2283317 RepID=A0A369VUF0_9SPHN|nr:bifunctional hydroxymethylpyrimidine kinase/phosphomethylpyrimidine kinase [Sphingomonas aracearum]RDE04820.1 bifunctional hydroxymethylpyrimidine kinase/phosphomethylpyrimidine kinase [Sphingomonas aracearum]